VAGKIRSIEKSDDLVQKEIARQNVECFRLDSLVYRELNDWPDS
jgi:hypothetical protein